MPASKKRNGLKRRSSYSESKEYYAQIYGAWVNVWHGVKVSDNGSSSKFFPSELFHAKESFFTKLMHFPKLGFFPRLHSIKNPRKPHKDLLYILLNMPWPMLLFTLGIVYFVMIISFAGGILICKEQLSFADATYLSFHTLATIGYGHVFPVSRCGNYMITIEAFASMIVLSMLTGLVFAKFAKPRANIAFSNVCVIQPYGSNRMALIIRAANATSSRHVRHDVIMEASFRVTLLRIEKLKQKVVQQHFTYETHAEANAVNFAKQDNSRLSEIISDETLNENLVLCNYELELAQCNFITFRMGVALVHIIDDKSPFYGLQHSDIVNSDMLLHVVMTGVDSTLQDTVTENYMYGANDIRWGERFEDMLNFHHDERGVEMDFAKLSNTTLHPFPNDLPKMPLREPTHFGIRTSINRDLSSFNDMDCSALLQNDKSFDELVDEDSEIDQRIDATSHDRRKRYLSLGHRSSFSMEPLFEPMLSQGSMQTESHTEQFPRQRSIRTSQAIGSTMNSAVASQNLSLAEIQQIQNQLIGEGELMNDPSELESEFPYVLDSDTENKNEEHAQHVAFARMSSGSVADVQSIPRFVRITPQNIPSQFSVLGLYYKALHVKWTPIVLVFIAVFVVINLVFGILFFFESDRVAVNDELEMSTFEASFFLSVHTLSTIGYGSITPDSTYLNFWIIIEGTIGLITVTLLTGISWSKFARPRAHIIFSKNILITTLYGNRCVVFRAANTRHHGDIRESTFRIGVLMSNAKAGLRHLYNVPLVSPEWPSFTLSATLIHVIDKNSPFANIHTVDDISNCRVAVIVLFSGLDTTFAENVYERHMYFWDDFAFNQHFEDNVKFSQNRVTLDFRRFNSLIDDGRHSL